MFGQEDVINQREYSTTVRCLSSEASVFSISADKFIEKLSRDEKTWKMLISHSFNKDMNTRKQIKDTTFFKSQERKGTISSNGPVTPVQAKDMPAATSSDQKVNQS